MSRIDFACTPTPLPLASIAGACGVDIPAGVDAARHFRAVSSLERAGPDEVAFHPGGAESADLIATRAGACFVSPHHRSDVPAHTIALVTDDPLGAFFRTAGMLHADGVLRSVFESKDIDRAAIVHADARLEPGVAIDPAAVVGPRVEIGSGTTIGANSVIGAGVRIGRGCAIDTHVSIKSALIGDRVVIHAGARIGLSGPSLRGQRIGRAPHLGRVIIQDDVEIGANAIVDCSHAGDTMIGDGARVGVLAYIEGGITIERGAFVPSAGFSSGPEMV